MSYEIEFEQWRAKLPNNPFKLRIAKAIKPENWWYTWEEEMTNSIGNTFEIEDKNSLNWRLEFSTALYGRYSFPFQCFEVVKDKFFYAI